MQMSQRARLALKVDRKECGWQRHTSHDGVTQKRKRRNAK